VPIDLLEGHLMACLDPDTGAPAFGLQPVHERCETFPPGRTRGDSYHPPEDLVSFDESDLVAGRGGDACALEACRAPTDDENV
jgi:hypothetical protein